MIKKNLSLITVASLICSVLSGCASGGSATKAVNSEAHKSAGGSIEVYHPVEAPAGQYYSELTGELLDESLRDQRPIAVMVDNEILAYPHYGVARYGDIVYELVNSAVNGRITRLMVIVKDWQNIDQLGSIRSTRDTNLWIQPEYNFVLCHDGSSDTAEKYFYQDWSREHFSGTFERIPNGKNWEFTEYVTAQSLADNFEVSGYSKNYTDLRPKESTHFLFDNYDGVEISYDGEQPCTYVKMPFPHNGSELKYNAETGTFDYYSYGMLHVDGQDDRVLTFDNVLVLNTVLLDIDENYHVAYDIVNMQGTGYYLYDGKMIPITWKKGERDDIMKYYDMDGNRLIMKRGKTYIGFAPSDSWDNLIIGEYDGSAEESGEVPEYDDSEVGSDD